jgi:spermidine synthase
VVCQGAAHLSFVAALVFAGVAGFISLSYEILWFRVSSYNSGGSPVTFGLLLGIYLGGIAIGSDIAGKFCRLHAGYERGQGIWWLAVVTFMANLVAWIVIPLMAVAASSPGKGWMGAVPVVVASALFGALLPLVSHIGIAPDARAGRGLARVYSANIVGSVTGSLMTGFVLMDVWTTEQIALFLAIAGLVLVGALATGAGKRFAFTALLLAASAAAFVIATPRLFDRLYERLQFKEIYDGSRFANIVENRHGVIAVSDSGVTYGGGAYDGQVSTSLLDDRNGIERAYAVVGLHQSPRKVLMIGLSTGAWAQVIANSPDVDSLTIVEINPGYLDLIARYPVVAGILKNSKVRIVIDDGRRWLVRNPGRRFDFIVSNTTFHYRANTTNLLSREFLELVRQHLLPGGVFHFNTTSSQDAMKTAFTVFPYGLRMLNFVAVSDSPVALDSARWHDRLEQYTIEGRPVFDFDRELDRKRFESLVQLPRSIDLTPTSTGLESRESVLSRIPEARVVTDDNMLPEWHSLVLQSAPGRTETSMRDSSVTDLR